MTADRTTATRRAEHLLDDIHNGIGDPKQLRLSLIALVHADLAGGSTGGSPLRATSYDRAGGGQTTEHYVDEPAGSRQLTAAEIAAGTVPDWSITVEADPVGDATLARAGAERDQVHELRTKAEGYAKDAANALHALQNVCAAFMQLRDDNANTPAVRYCPCAKHREIDNPPVQHTGTVGGRLDRDPGLTSGQLADLLEPPATGTTRQPDPVALTAQAATAEMERNAARSRGDSCDVCHGAYWLGPDLLEDRTWGPVTPCPTCNDEARTA